MINRCQHRSWIAPCSLASFSVHFLGYVQWVSWARMTCQQQKPPCTGTFRWALSCLGCTPVSDVSALCWQWPLFLCVSPCLISGEHAGVLAACFSDRHGAVLHISLATTALCCAVLWQTEFSDRRSAVLHISLTNTALHCTISSLTEFSDIWSAVLHISLANTVLFCTVLWQREFSDRQRAVLHISLANTALCYTVLWQTRCCLVLLSFFLLFFFFFWGGGGGEGADTVLHNSLTDMGLCCIFLCQIQLCGIQFSDRHSAVYYFSLFFFVFCFGGWGPFVFGGGGHIQCCVVQFSVRCSAVLYSSLVDRSAGLYKQCCGW